MDYMDLDVRKRPLNLITYSQVTQSVLLIVYINRDYIDGLVQERPNSIAKALELRLSCTNP